MGGSAVNVAAGDSGISVDVRKGVQSAIKDHVAQHLVSGRYVIYDAVAGHLKKLKLDEIHEEIASVDDFYGPAGPGL